MSKFFNVKIQILSAAALMFLASQSSFANTSRTVLDCSNPTFRASVTDSFTPDGQLQFQWLTVSASGVGIIENFVSQIPSVNSGAYKYTDDKTVELEVYKGAGVAYLTFLASLPDNIKLVCSTLE